MEFQITRTSGGLCQTEKPCENCIKRGDDYYINIDTLEELLNFIKSINNKIIIEKHVWSNPYDNDNIKFDIEIYDYYRE